MKLLANSLLLLELQHVLYTHWPSLKEDLQLLLSGQRLISGALGEIPGMSVWPQTFKAGSNSSPRSHPIWLITPYKWPTGSLGITFDSGSVGLSISWDYKGTQLLKPFTMPEHSKMFETCGLLSDHKLLREQPASATGRKMPAVANWEACMGQSGPKWERMKFYTRTLQWHVWIFWQVTSTI